MEAMVYQINDPNESQHTIVYLPFYQALEQVKRGKAMFLPEQLYQGAALNAVLFNTETEKEQPQTEAPVDV